MTNKIRNIEIICRSDIFNENKITMLLYHKIDNIALYRNDNEAMFMARGLDDDKMVIRYPVNSDSNSYWFAWQSNKCSLYELGELDLIPKDWSYKEVVVN